MKIETKLYNKILDDIYYTFINNENYLSVGSVIKDIRKKYNVVLYDRYGKENILKIHRTRLSYNRLKIRNSKPIVYSEEAKKKIGDANRKVWAKDDGTRRKNGNDKPKEETKQKMRDAWTDERRKEQSIRSKNIEFSKETLKRMSDATKKLWKEGKFNREGYKSKGHLEIEETIKSLGYDIESEHIIGTKPYDIFVKDLNIVIEFNGTYWHLDERFYPGNFYDKSRNLYANDVREYDRLKMEYAKNKGYSTHVIWQSDWNKLNNKQEYIKQLLNI